MVASDYPASIIVQWEPPSDMHKEITGYKIQYTNVDSNDKKSIKVPKESCIKIHGLVPCQRYSVCVASMKNHTTGLFSDNVEGVAGEDCELYIHT